MEMLPPLIYSDPAIRVELTREGDALVKAGPNGATLVPEAAVRVAFALLDVFCPAAMSAVEAAVARQRLRLVEGGGGGRGMTDLEQRIRPALDSLGELGPEDRVRAIVGALAASIAQGELPLVMRLELIAMLTPEDWRPRLAGILAGIADAERPEATH